MTIFEKPLRMCIVCRARHPQKNLFRLQCKDAKLGAFSGIGRSFYVCLKCAQAEDFKKIQKILNKQCKNSGDFVPQFKEIIQNARTNQDY
jgi:predicted RNA-binding protein YlxR (DUF448 family)